MIGFITRLRAELIDPLANDGQGEWELLSDLLYRSRDGALWTVPTGFLTDFASVPRLPFIYAWAGNTAHAPSALHDWAIRTDACSRQRADELYCEAMESIGMPPSRIGLMYRGVSGYTRLLAARLNPWSEE